MFTSRIENQEAMDQQRMLNEEAVQEEQRRLLEEDAQREQRRIQRVESSRKSLILKGKKTRVQISSGELVIKLSQDSISEF